MTIPYYMENNGSLDPGTYVMSQPHVACQKKLLETTPLSTLLTPKK